MEQLLIEVMKTGNVTSMFLTLMVYVLIHFQRKNTKSERDTDMALLKQRVTNIEKTTNLFNDKLDRVIESLNFIQIELAKINAVDNAKEKFNAKAGK